MIERNSTLPDYFMELNRHESFGNYARSYGDSIAEHYENNGIVLIPHMPIACDLAFLQSITMPKAFKKIGSADGIEECLVARKELNLGLHQNHPLLRILNNTELALYLQYQITSFNAQLRQGLSILFPKYYSLREGNITWRLTETQKEGMHLDIYGGGAPRSAEQKKLHRLKLFINIDNTPRLWQTSYALPALLKACHADLPTALPDDVNVINNILDKIGVLEKLPYHKINFPTLSAVLANGETVAHEVVYGRRAIGVEFFCDAGDMLNPAKHSYTALRGWLKDAGIGIADNAAACHAQYAHLKGGYERLMEAQQTS